MPEYVLVMHRNNDFSRKVWLALEDRVHNQERISLHDNPVEQPITVVGKVEGLTVDDFRHKENGVVIPFYVEPSIDAAEVERQLAGLTRLKGFYGTRLSKDLPHMVQEACAYGMVTADLHIVRYQPSWHSSKPVTLTLALPPALGEVVVKRGPVNHTLVTYDSKYVPPIDIGTVGGRDLMNSHNYPLQSAKFWERAKDDKWRGIYTPTRIGTISVPLNALNSSYRTFGITDEGPLRMILSPDHIAPVP